MVTLGLISELTQSVSGLRLYPGHPGTGPFSFPLTCDSTGFAVAVLVPSVCLVQNSAELNVQMEGLCGLISLLLSILFLLNLKS